MTNESLTLADLYFFGVHVLFSKRNKYDTSLDGKEKHCGSCNQWCKFCIKRGDARARSVVGQTGRAHDEGARFVVFDEFIFAKRLPGEK